MKFTHKTNLITTFVGSVMLLSSTGVTAQNKKQTKPDSPWYLQASIGSIFESDAESEANKQLNALGHSQILSSDVDYGTSFQIEVGFKLSENIALTAGYVDFGDMTSTLTVNTKFDSDLIADLADVGPKYGNGNTYGVVYRHEVAPKLMASVDVGIIFLESEYSVPVNIGTAEIPAWTTSTTSETSREMYMGLGASYLLLGKFEVGGYYRYYDIDNVPSHWGGIRLGLHF
ncbi:outer membrane beta-barrel protein [Paraglaciecola sp.]|uniref:outer membrane beta-barrel protein n=1 Tax=Paraglaciecola sp. TaxID=1920173 RepID=UPI003EF43B62